jgi:hypothetical protein
MKAYLNSDKSYIDIYEKDTTIDGHKAFYGSVGVYYIKSNILQIHSGYAKHLTNILKLLRKCQEYNELSHRPVSVMYW